MQKPKCHREFSIYHPRRKYFMCYLMNLLNDLENDKEIPVTTEKKSPEIRKRSSGQLPMKGRDLFVWSDRHFQNQPELSLSKVVKVKHAGCKIFYWLFWMAGLVYTIFNIYSNIMVYFKFTSNISQREDLDVHQESRIRESFKLPDSIG